MADSTGSPEKVSRSYVWKAAVLLLSSVEMVDLQHRQISTCQAAWPWMLRAIFTSRILITTVLERWTLMAQFGRLPGRVKADSAVTVDWQQLPSFRIPWASPLIREGTCTSQIERITGCGE